MVNKETGTSEFYNVEYDIQPIPEEVVWDGVIVKESMWAYAREQSAKEKMRECYEDVISKKEGSFASLSHEYAQELRERFSKEKMYSKEMFFDALNIRI